MHLQKHIKAKEALSAAVSEDQRAAEEITLAHAEFVGQQLAKKAA